jgi:formylglycine-generating enzyme required for sulfatase activity
MNALSRAIGAEAPAVAMEAPAKPAPAAKRRPAKKKPKPEKAPIREEPVDASPAAGPQLPRWAWVAGVGAIVVTILVVVGLSLGGGRLEQSTQVAQSVPTGTEAPIEPTRPSTASLDIGSTMISPVDEATLVFVPEGTFEMGGGGGIYAEEDENPQHQVYLDGFWIDRTEVTNAMFASFLNAQGNQEEGGVNWLDDADPEVRIHMQAASWQVDAGYELHPVIEVSWYGARAYCEWAGRRLPTEAEWEKAARGTEGQLYPWGEAQWDCDKSQYTWCDGQTLAVGSKPAGESPYGALDMAGNVWEWVADWYDAGYYEVSADTNPQGPASGDRRVLRGGSWAVHPAYGRAASRHALAPEETGDALGFRCAFSP